MGNKLFQCLGNLDFKIIENKRQPTKIPVLDLFDEHPNPQVVETATIRRCEKDIGEDSKYLLYRWKLRLIQTESHEVCLATNFLMKDEFNSFFCYEMHIYEEKFISRTLGDISKDISCLC